MDASIERRLTTLLSGSDRIWFHWPTLGILFVFALRWLAALRRPG